MVESSLFEDRPKSGFGMDRIGKGLGDCTFLIIPDVVEDMVESEINPFIWAKVQRGKMERRE